MVLFYHSFIVSIKRGIGQSHEARKMTDNELWASLYKKYGRDFDPKALPEDDPLVIEFWNRVSRGFS